MGCARGLRGAEVLAIVALLLAAVPACGAWSIELITTVNSLNTPPALTFDALDRPHMVYGSPLGILLHVNGTTPGGLTSGWTVPRDTGIGVETTGTPGVAHITAAGNDIWASYTSYSRIQSKTRVARNGISWADYTPVTGSGYAVNGMAVDNTGKVGWVIDRMWTSGTNIPGVTGTGKYLVQPTGTNAVAGVAVAPNLSHYPTFSSALPADAVFRMDGEAVFDRQGNLQTVQYYEIGGNGFLAYAKGPAGGPFAVDDNVDMGWWAKTGRPSIVVDAAGTPHIAYTEMRPHYGVRYVTQTATGWIGETIASGGDLEAFCGTFPDVVVDPFGVPHVIYADPRQGLLMHAFKAAGSWQYDVIDTISTQALKGSMSGALAAGIDSTGGIGVGYWDGTMLKYAYMAVPEPVTLALLAVAVMRIRRRGE